MQTQEGLKNCLLGSRYMNFALTVKIHVFHLTSVFPTRILLKFLINLHFSNKRYNNFLKFIYFEKATKFYVYEFIITLILFLKESFCQKFCFLVHEILESKQIVKASFIINRRLRFPAGFRFLCTYIYFFKNLLC